MTQFNAGNALPCLECDGRRERARREDIGRECERDNAARMARERARARYRSPEAVAKRVARKAERRRVEAETRQKRAAELASVMAGFARFF